MSQELIIYYGTVLKKYKNEYYCNGAFGRYIDELSKKVKRIYLILPTETIQDTKNINEYKIESKNIVFQELPLYKGYISALKNQKKIKESIKKYSEKWNANVYIRWPVPFFHFVYKLSKRKNLKITLHLVGDPLTIVAGGVKYRGIMKVLAVSYAKYNTLIIQNLIRKTPTLVNGNGLRKLYDIENNNIKEIRTSTFKEKEVENSRKSLERRHVKLLYVGYLRHEKGLPYLLEAFQSLVKSQRNLSLTIVGTGPMYDELLSIVEDMEIQSLVNFKGFIPMGERLFDEYRNHDIFVLPSISEGTPRVLLEAMSTGMPIIASNVGGIPFTITDNFNGILVEPKKPMEIRKALEDIMEDNELREKLVNNSINFAKENTLEAHVKEVLTFIKHGK